MGKITKIEEIIEKIKNGASRESIEKEYVKGTVTKAYNKMQEAESSNSNTKELNKNIKEDKIKNIIQNLFASIEEGEEYEININISRKIINKTKPTKEEGKLEVVENPFEIYNNLGKKEYLKKLTKTKKDDLERIIKKYFSLNKKEMTKYTIKELAQYIINEVERNLNIGECFK